MELVASHTCESDTLDTNISLATMRIIFKKEPQDQLNRLSVKKKRELVLSLQSPFTLFIVWIIDSLILNDKKKQSKEHKRSVMHCLNANAREAMLSMEF